MADLNIIEPDDRFTYTDEEVYAQRRANYHNPDIAEIERELDSFEASFADTPNPIPEPEPEPEPGFGEKVLSGVETGLHGVAWLTSPLTTLQAGALAPIAHEYDSEGFFNQSAEAMKVSGQAMMKALFPTYGEVQEYGTGVLEAMDPSWKGKSSVWKTLLASSIDVAADPSLVLGFGARKLVQEGLKVSKAARMAKGGEPSGGIFESGMNYMFNIVDVSAEERARAMMMARKADRGDTKAAQEVADMADSPEMTEAMGDRIVREIEDEVANINKAFDPDNVSREGERLPVRYAFGHFSAKNTVANLPEVPDGHTRLYGAMLPDGSGTWNVDVKKAAEQYSHEGVAEGGLRWKDVPTESLGGKAIEGEKGAYSFPKPVAGERQPAVRMAPKSDPDVVAESISKNVSPTRTSVNIAAAKTPEGSMRVAGEIFDRHLDDFHKAAETGKYGPEGISDAAQQGRLQDFLGKEVTPMAAPEAYALRMTGVDVARQVTKMAARAKASPSALNNVAYEDAWQALRTITEADTARASEWGKAGRAYSIATDDVSLVRRTQEIVQKHSPDELDNLTRDMFAALHNADPKGVVSFSNGVKGIVSQMKNIMKSEKGTVTIEPGFFSNEVRRQYTDPLYKLFIHSVLSGPVTHAKNMTSTAMNLALQPAVQFASVAPAYLRSSAEGAARINEAKHMVYGAVESFTDAYKVARYFNSWVKGDVKTNFDYPYEIFQTTMTTEMAENAGQAAYVSDVLNATHKTDLGNPAAKAAKKYIPEKVSAVLPGDLLRREDFFFKVLSYRMGLRRYAAETASTRKGNVEDTIVKLLDKPTAYMHDSANQFSAYATFQKELGQTGKAITTAVHKAPGLRWFFPFIRTPVNLVKVGMEYTPFGFFKELADATYKGEGFSAKTDVAFAKAAMGGALATTVLSTLPEDSITGSGERGSPFSFFMETSGMPENSIKVGKEWWGYGGLEPLRFLLSTAANYKTAVNHLDLDSNEDLTAFEIHGAAILGAYAESAIDSNYVTSINTVVTAVKALSAGEIFDVDEKTGQVDVTKGLGRKAAEKVGAAMVVPNFLAQLNSRLSEDLGGDPTLRMADGLIQRMQSRIPGLSKDLQPYRDLFGDPIMMKNGLGPDILSPIPVRDDHSDDPVIQEIVDLKVAIPRASRMIQGVEMTHPQYSEYLRIAGQGSKKDGLPSMKDNLQGVMEDGIYDRLSDIGKADFMRRVINEQRKAARQILVDKDKSLDAKIDANIALKEQMKYK